MSGVFLHQADLRALLLRRCHTLPLEIELSSDVIPERDAVVTMAVNLDPVQMPVYRERYFATLVDQEYRPLIHQHPDFALPKTFAAALESAPVGGRGRQGNFLLGPMHWLVHRLATFPRLLLWPEDKIRASGDLGLWDTVDDEMPRLRTWLQCAGPLPPGGGAIVLDTAVVGDCRVLWEVAAQVEAGFYNFYVADVGATEVYELHHHSKVFVSIPDSGERQKLLDEFAKYQDVVEDCSGYVMDDDDDDDWLEEQETAD